MAGYLEIGPLHSRLVWKGSVPVKISLLPLAFVLGQDGLDLRLHSERVNLSLLTSISKEVQAAEGPLDLVAEARGESASTPGFRVCALARRLPETAPCRDALPPGPRRDSPPGRQDRDSGSGDPK